MTPMYNTMYYQRMRVPCTDHQSRRVVHRYIGTATNVCLIARYHSCRFKTSIYVSRETPESIGTFVHVFPTSL